MKRSLLIIMLISLFLVGCKDKEANTEKSKAETGKDIECEYIFLNSSPEEKKLEDSTDIQLELAYSDELDEMVKMSDSIIIASVTDKEETIKNDKDALVETPIKIELISVLKGDENIKIDKIFQAGGIISIENYMKGSSDKDNKNSEYNKLSDEEKKTTFKKILYPHYYKELKKDGVYVFLLSKKEDGQNYQSFNMSFSILELDRDCAQAKALTSDTINKDLVKDKSGKDYVFKQTLDDKEFSPDKTFTLEEIVKEINNQ